ncbi:Diaminobutyrate-pyruvate aminotransferase [Pseudonocardia sp. Ae168_Ps1]|uniref:diaminobutyrate--2-oxoglutarate transaminase n=1 Tax=unclassified Pseudonocardia TaxID=2619320 RepID=UPI0001FFE0EE|nr:MULTISPECIES: diaminobutyrate--2-oxoglutarate transaminase [unclassified Pseudonocardia]ALE75831.1 diaminobutyrate--2-oxoglutarate aminotransferase [Pseudonocardia sp. EC080625-04]ALL75210.1 diaminobutyrate--2-oxoglutarate aminotransferase [Pseudonocardia sp. EC080610-09]ALL82235.1 diaminobutyrate--2-oxoglutarate aminotransferase [Pseudonocardia sp. EC080619-01]OLL74587.1 Diaminobutyrate-pyruvate aminotransferase [Pseudonocardia sp. Ae150A_Ps1]OLL80566.1 Diaminobutyrate-pyruvate aminotransf
MTVFEDLESQVRSYCRNWPVVFDTAKGSRLTDVDGNSYLDFFGGAGALNYGHNPEALKKPLLDYLASDGITHGLDMYTRAKGEFLNTFQDVVLAPRGLEYKVQFPGPTGANAVESALKLARKISGREALINFTNAFHGMTLGALSVTGNSMKRGGAGIPLVHSTPMPFDNYFDGKMPDFLWFEKVLDDTGSSLNEPAAVIVETVQGEGGLNPARIEWLQGLRDLCTRKGILMIVDDVQMGCGRTGPFFSFEIAGIQPDIVTISKSISGYGLPMALVLIKPEYDQWGPGEHNGTFRGNNPAFVTATHTLRNWWTDDTLEKDTIRKGQKIEEGFNKIIGDNRGTEMFAKGRGLARGIQFEEEGLAEKIAGKAFEHRLLLETAGPNDEVLKLLPPLTTTDDEIDEGLGIIGESVRTVIGS